MGRNRKYGTDIGVGNYVLNNDHTCDYGGLEDAIGAEAYKAFAKEPMSRKLKGKSERAFKDFADKVRSPRGGENSGKWRLSIMVPMKG